MTWISAVMVKAVAHTRGLVGYEGAAEIIRGQTVRPVRYMYCR